MMDIRGEKQELRRKYREIRKNLSPTTKSAYDKAIFDKVVGFEKYKQSKTLLCFVSTSIEVDTIKIIENAFSQGKRVAVPKCLDMNGKMAFFLIKSLNELEVSSFGLLEPRKDAKMLVDFSQSICILPGFAFDPEGYRIGFGKGYYDRFLQKYTGIRLAICYNSCIANNLPRGRFDVAADYIVTQKYILTIKPVSKN